MISYQIRPFKTAEIEFLKDMLFEAIFLPEETKKLLTRDFIFQPSIKKYFENWGQSGDLAFVAETSDNQKLIGCIWGRLFPESNKGYGFVDEQTPELSIAVLPDYRNMGIGASLFKALVDEYLKLNYKKLSLSVNENNPSLKLYERLGFKINHKDGDAFVMIKEI